MDESLVGIMEIVGPAILLIVLIWLVMRRRADRTRSHHWPLPVRPR